MFKGTLEVGKEYELNNGEVYKCEGSVDCLLKIGMSYYTHDGRYCASTADHTRSVRGPAVGTLAELGVKPGDVVVLFGYHGVSTFRIISRAEHTAKTDAPTIFGDMTDAEKGALMLAKHNGESIEMRLYDDMWEDKCDPSWNVFAAYRVKPKPVVKTVVLSGNYEVGFTDAVRLKHTHKLKFDMIDGEPTNPRFERW